jgi:hypothetical protein
MGRSGQERQLATHTGARKQTCGWGVDGGQVIMHRYEQ